MKFNKDHRAVGLISAVLSLALIFGALTALSGCGSGKKEHVAEAVEAIEGDGTGALSIHAGNLHFLSLSTTFYSDDQTTYFSTSKLIGADDSLFDISPQLGCYDGDSFYVVEGKEGFARYKPEGDIMQRTSLVDFSDTGENYFGKYLSYMRSPVACGKYVYFIISLDFVYGKGKLPEPLGRIGRIDKSTGEISHVGGDDITASAFTIKDGWIYYLNFNSENGGKEHGVYKMKADGTNDTLLHSQYIAGKNTIIADPNSDSLYYTANTRADNSDKSCVCTVKTDSQGFEKLAETDGSMETVTSLALDGSRLFYNTIGNGTTLNLIDTQTKEVEKGVISSFFGDSQICADDGWLYPSFENVSTCKRNGLDIKVESKDPQNPGKLFIRYRIEEGYRPEYFYAYINSDGIAQGHWS